MSVKSAQAITRTFTTVNPEVGSAVDADALPTGKLAVNGVDNAAVVTVTNVATGRYKAAFTLPTLAAGDGVELVITATVSGITGKSVVWRDTADSARPGEVYARIGVPAGASLAADITALPTDTDVQTAAAAALTAYDGPTRAEATSDKDAVLTAIAALPDDTDVAALDTILDAIKAKTDTLGGAGAIAWSYTLTAAGGAPIADADVWVTTDAVGANVIASARTNASGVATFYLDAGTVYVWAQKSGWSFSNPDVEVVA